MLAGAILSIFSAFVFFQAPKKSYDASDDEASVSVAKKAKAAGAKGKGLAAKKAKKGKGNNIFAFEVGFV